MKFLNESNKCNQDVEKVYWKWTHNSAPKSNKYYRWRPWSNLTTKPSNMIDAHVTSHALRM